MISLNRFKRFKPSFLTNKGVRSWRPGPFLFVAAALYLLSLCVGIYLFFPVEELKQRIVQETQNRTGVRLEIDSLSLFPLLSLKAAGLNVHGNNLPFPLQIDQLKLSPQWTSLVSGDQAVVIDADVMGGSVRSVVKKGGAVSVEAAQLNFDLPIQEPISFNVAGALDQADFNGAMRLNADTLTSLSLNLSGSRVTGLDFLGEGNDAINIGTIRLTLIGQGRAMKVESLTVSGGDFTVEGSGNLLIGRSAASSRINLDLQIRPTANADPTLASLLELNGKPDANGNFNLNLTGSLARPLIK